MLAWLVPLFFFAVLLGSPVPGFLLFMGIGLVQVWRTWRQPGQPGAWVWTRQDTMLALCFMSIPLFKAATLIWTSDARLVLGNVAWHLYFLFWPLVLLGLARCTTGPADQIRVDTALALGLVVTALLGVYAVQVNGAPHLGMLGNVGITAQLLMVAGSWNLLALTRRGPAPLARRALLAAAFVGTWTALVLTTRRLELLGFAGLCLLILLYRVWRQLRPLHRVWLVLASLAAAAWVLSLRWEKFALGITEIQSYLTRRAQGLPYVDSSWGARLEMWRLGWQGFIDHPLLGLSASARPLNMPGAPDLEIFGHRHFHSHLIQTAVEGGLLGLTVFIMCLWQSTRLLIVNTWTTHRETALMAAALLGAYAMEGAASATLIYDKPNALLVVASAWVWLQQRPLR